MSSKQNNADSGKKLIIVGIILVIVAMWNIVGPIIGFAFDLIFGIFGTLLTIALILILWGIYNLLKASQDGSASAVIIHKSGDADSLESTTIIKGDD